MTAFGIYGKEVPVGKKNIQNVYIWLKNPKFKQIPISL